MTDMLAFADRHWDDLVGFIIVVVVFGFGWRRRA